MLPNNPPPKKDKVRKRKERFKRWLSEWRGTQVLPLSNMVEILGRVPRPQTEILCLLSAEKYYHTCTKQEITMYYSRNLYESMTGHNARNRISETYEYKARQRVCVVLA